MPATSPSHFISPVKPDNNMLHKQVENFWKINSAGMRDEVTAMSVADQQVLCRWEDSITPKNGQYELGIPFKETEVCMPKNRPMAEVQLQSLFQKFEKELEIKDKYTAVMKDLLAFGYAVKVPSEKNRT